MKSIRARLKGKEGGLRGNLMGKHVGFSVHTVITGDPNLELDEVGVLKSIAMSLAYSECGESNPTCVGSYPTHPWPAVTPYNVAYLQELMRNGPIVYPGSPYVIRDTGERVDLRYNKRVDTFLQYG